MEIAKILSPAAIRALELEFVGGEEYLDTAAGRTRPMFLDGFIAATQRVAQEHQLLDDSGTLEASDVLEMGSFNEATSRSVFRRRNLMAIFHQIDFRDRKFVTWEEFTMFLVDDAKGGKRRTVDGSEETQRMDRYREVARVRQDPVGAIHSVKYVAQWDRLLRLTSFNGEFTVELAKVAGVGGRRGKSFEVVKRSAPTKARAVAAEAIVEHNLIATINDDISCNFYATHSSLEELHSSSQLLHQREVGMKELSESQTAILWQPRARRLMTGSRSGVLVPWDLQLDRSSTAERFKPRTEWRWPVFLPSRQAISCMVPWEDRVIAGSLASTRNIAVLDIERHVAMNVAGDSLQHLSASSTLEDYKEGHKLGVLSLAVNEFSEMVVSAGFERTPFLWILKLPHFQPWKLVDPQEPHRGDINGLFCPPNTPQVVSTDTRGVVKVWDVRTFQCVQTINCDKRKSATGPASTVFGVRYSNSNNSGIDIDRHRDTFYASVTHNSTMGAFYVCSPFTTTVLSGDAPQFLDCADDEPVVVCRYNVSTATFMTAHGRSVKVWNDRHGAVSAHFANITRATITAMVLDHRGRKFFVGDAGGCIQGHVVATGVCYRRFRPLGVPVAALAYSVFRSGRRYLFACGGEELVACDDSELDGKQSKITQPLHLMRTELLRLRPPTPRVDSGPVAAAEGLILMRRATAVKRCCDHTETLQVLLPTPPPNQADPCGGRHKPGTPTSSAAAAVSFSKLATQSKLSITLVVSGTLAAALDIGTMSVVHLFSVKDPIACITTLGDLPAVAILDTSFVLYIFAIRPSLSAEALLLQKQLLDDETEVLRLSDRSVPTCMTFHQNKRRIIIGDSAGSLVQWELAGFVKSCGLAPAAYPLTSLAEAVLRKRHEVVDAERASSSVVLTRKIVAHEDEINSIEVIFSSTAVTVATSSFDHRVKVWDFSLSCVGELAQGRISSHAAVTDAKALHEYYHRNRIRPFRFIMALPEDEEMDLADFSEFVLRLLRRTVHRFRARKQRALREALSQGTTADDPRLVVNRGRESRNAPPQDREVGNKSPGEPTGASAAVTTQGIRNVVDTHVHDNALAATEGMAMSADARNAEVNLTSKWDVLTKVEIGEHHVHAVTAGVGDLESEDSIAFREAEGTPRHRALRCKRSTNLHIGAVQPSTTLTPRQHARGQARWGDDVASSLVDECGKAPEDGQMRRSTQRCDAGEAQCRADLPLTLSTIVEAETYKNSRREEQLAKRCNINLQAFDVMRQTIEQLAKRHDHTWSHSRAVVLPHTSRVRANHYDRSLPPLPSLPQINMSHVRERRTMREEADRATKRLCDAAATNNVGGAPAPLSARPLAPARMDPLASPSLAQPHSLAQLTDIQQRTAIPASKSTGFSSSIYNSSHTISFWAA